MGVPWYAWLVCAAASVGLLLSWAFFVPPLVRALPRRRHDASVARFATANGWVYTRQEWLDLGLGVPFVPGETAPCRNVVAGLVDGRRFRAFEYAHRLQVVMIELKQALPFVEVTPRVLTAEATDGAADVHLESEEFDRRFRVRANDSRYAVAILHPQLMDVLLAGPELSWRILGRDLVAWEPGSLDPRGIKPALGLLESIRDAIPTFVWHDYGKSAEHVP